jgi:phosphoenolpyruvate carboxykinase (ATP)
MKEIGSKNPNMDLNSLGISSFRTAYWNLTPEELVEHSIKNNQGVLADNGAICIETGEFTGRSPADRFIVKDDITSNTVDWGKVNKPFDADKFDQLSNKITNYFADKDIYVRDAYACAEEKYRLNIRLVSEYPWSNQFAYNMFLRPDASEIKNFETDWTILCAPGCMADPAVDGTRQHNFAILNFSKKQIIIGGTGYTGEIKKGIFSVLNYVLPANHNVLAMHCSANVGKDGDTAVFFGLSGTGKTTLSADPDRNLIGDDEHGWSNEGVFNFEGGCYAKTIDLTEEKEPDIYRAIKHHAILENIKFFEGTRTPDYFNAEITQNTRVSYPIHHIDNALPQSKGGIPTNIFFLTCDAFGVLPPISKLTPGQAMYHFISGYTAKVAGTEEGINEPQTTFSACFGSPFLPLHPTQYAEMLGEKMQEHKVNVWLINTGWTSGGYGDGSRIKLKYTRAMIGAALEGKLNNVEFTRHKVFGLQMPKTCPNVPDNILDPSNTWSDRNEYYQKAQELAKAFNENFKQFASEASTEILEAAPVENVLAQQ